MKKLTIILVSVFFLYGCRKNEVEKNEFPPIGSGSHYSISGIKSFVTKTSGLFLYQITDDSRFEKVKFLNTRGKPVFDTTRTYIKDVYMLDPDYIVFEGSFVLTDDETEYESVLYSKKDSMFHSFPDQIDMEMSVRFLLSGNFQEDGFKNVYYYNQVFPKNVIRLALPDFNSGSVLSQSFNEVEFLVTGKGDLMYRIGEIQPDEDKFSVKFANGEEGEVTISIPVDPEFIVDGVNPVKTNLGLWQGADKEVYLLTGWSKSAGTPENLEEGFDVKDIYQISFSSKSIQYERILSVEEQDVLSCLMINRLSQYKIFRNDLVYFVSKIADGFSGIKGWSFNHKTKEVKEFSLPYRKDIISLSYSDNYIFLAFEDELIRMSFDNFSYSSLLYVNPDAFYISKLGASNEDDVYFEAIRSSDTHRVLGKIDKFGSLSYIDEALKGSISTFLRVN